MSTVALAHDLGIEAAGALKQHLALHLDQSGPLRVDASQVARVHTAAIQVLCAFVLARRQTGQDTIFDQATQTLRDAARLLGAAQVMGLETISNESTFVENAA